MNEHKCTAITVSEQTANYIALKKSINDLFDHFYKVVTSEYSEETFNKLYLPSFLSLQEQVNDHLIDSIDLDLSKKEVTESFPKME